MKRLLSFIARRARRPEGAEDLLGEALFRVTRRESLHAADYSDAMIVRAALNVEIDEFRRERRIVWEHDDVLMDCADTRPLEDEAAILRQRLARIESGMAHLPERTREIFLLRRVHGLSYGRIGRQFGISDSAVEKHIYRGIKFLSEWTSGW